MTSLAAANGVHTDSINQNDASRILIDGREQGEAYARHFSDG
jgi:hypothetical protein